MNKVVLTFSMMLAFSLHADPASTRLISKLDNLFTPHGFDDNDVVEVVVSGHFPSSCYQLGEALTEVDHEAKTVLVTPISYKREDVPCHQMISHYVQVIKLGKMLAGDYAFTVANNASLDKILNVKRAHANEQDDFLYPPVEYADVIRDGKGDLTLLMKGRYPRMKRGCMTTSEAIVQFQDDEMLVVQPKAEIDLVPGAHDGEGCTENFEKKFRLPFVAQGEILVHVRSINGQSYNRLVEVK